MQRAKLSIQETNALLATLGYARVAPHFWNFTLLMAKFGRFWPSCLN
jgi:hypothetical protein